LRCLFEFVAGELDRELLLDDLQPNKEVKVMTEESTKVTLNYLYPGQPVLI
jgi:hypothetical protein